MIPLLPYEKRLAEILGISQEKYQEWKAITLKHSIEKPAEGVRAGPLVPVLVSIAISVGVTLLSSLLFPTPQQARIVTKRGRRDPRTSNQRSSPRFGFDSLQQPAETGQFVPVVIAKREGNLGGVRVNLPLVWSQVLALNGSLMFRGIFLAGTANMSQSAWDQRGWAFGNNTLGAYAYTGTALSRGARYSIYYAPDGGRITSGQLLAGREASRDVGNSANDGAPDVFSVDTGGGYLRAFCMAESPSTSKAFGLYGWCPNLMLHRSTVQLQPTVVARVNSDGIVKTDDDAAALVELWKGKFHWSMRGVLTQYQAADSSEWINPAYADGDREFNKILFYDTFESLPEPGQAQPDAVYFTGQYWYVKTGQFTPGGPVVLFYDGFYGFSIEGKNVAIGDRLRYTLSRFTDAETKIKFDTSNCNIKDNKADSKQDMGGVAASVAGVQNSADTALIPNELYRIGTCWAILEERVPKDSETIFISDSENEPIGEGNRMEYIFTVVKAGRVQFGGPGFIVTPEQGTTILPSAYDPDTDFADISSGTEARYRVCSRAAQIFRMAIASFGAVREYRICEVTIKSKVGITINGLTGFRACPTVQEINAKAGQSQVNDDAEGRLTVSRFDSSGSLVTTKTRRYSAFAMQYSSDRGSTWTDFPEVFAVAGVNGEDVYNYLRIVFPSYKRWEVRFEPISSWEVRREGLNRVMVLDTNSDIQVSQGSGGVSVSTTGYIINPTNGKRRKLKNLEPDTDLGLGWSDSQYSSMIDGYARWAEAFPYDNVQSTVGTAPEHEIKHINYYGDLDLVPSYQGLASVGVNIAASLEFSSLGQFSGFCNNGYEMPRLLNSDTMGASHLFPDWLRELMTSAELGAFPATQSAQIDRPSFQEAAQWCQDREYFYDAVEDEPLNILDWATETAQAHLLKLVRLGGVYYLRKAIEFNTPLKIEAQFNNGNSEGGSFKLDSIDYLTRQPFIVQVKWREESVGQEAPLFPRERVAAVRQVGTSANAPVRTLDLSKWCTNYKQAIDAACYLIRFVTLHDHRISFRTTPDMLAAELRSGGYFKLDVDVTNYNKAVQGFIQENGTIVTTRPDLLPKADGFYPALTWDMDTDPQTQSILIVDGLAESPRECFFAIPRSGTVQRTYEIKKIDIDAEGIITIDAFHHPTNSNGISLLGVNWTTYVTDANWVIEL